ncbi:MAG: hypothetical protein M1360_00005 [Candidatus Marsarchaeota archaeon]|jgi:hypothetical protein|nr:hypothetical protein [Candidatus Marsarchaeota archaeon]MCL5418312.1 hypothetical protein [Candidatus Marsarchaeota archaeon]
MPIKYNLMNYDVIANSIHKLQAKNESEYAQDELNLRALGVLIASFSSSFSWQTYKRISEGAPISAAQELKDEFESARKSNWKHIRNVDVQEVVRTFGSMSKPARDKIFFDWLFFNVDKSMHEQLKQAWGALEKNLTVECDSVD